MRQGLRQGLRQRFPMAVWYGGGRTRATMVRHPEAGDRDAWLSDLRNIKECGFNAVKCWADWAAGEARPGAYRFDAQDLMLELAQEVGLDVIIQIYLDSAPDWLVSEFPDSRYVSQGGDMIDSQGAPGFCYDHPGVRRKAEEFMAELARRVRGSGAFLGWDLWSEPHVVQWAYFDYLPQPAVFCYCHYTVRRFREWLRAKYGTIEALNEAWYRAFTSWDVVDAPRFVSLMTATDFIDWQQFMLDKIALDLRWRAETVGRADPGHVLASHSDIPSIMTLPLLAQGAPDDWRMAKVVDVWGTSFYPKHVGARETNDPPVRSAQLAASKCACASAGKPMWLGELQGGHGYVGAFAVAATARDEAEWTWQPVSHGVKGLCFYAWHPMNKGYESAGFGLANLDGTPSDRARAAGEAARIVASGEELFLKAEPPKAEVAILYNVVSNIMWTAMRERTSYIPSRAMLGAYRPLFEENVPVDYVHLEEVEAGALSRYKVLYMPFSIAVTRRGAERIAEFVRAGGTVLAEARTGWNDERGACGDAVPGFGLAEAFGCREVAATSVDGPVPMVLSEAAALARVPGLRAGDELMGFGVRQELEPAGGAAEAEVVATFRNGAPAIVASHYGRGLAVLAGTFLSFAYETRRDSNTGRFLAGFALTAGLELPVIVEADLSIPLPPGAIEARVLEAGRATKAEEHILFVFNHADRALDVPVSVAVGGTAASACSLAPSREETPVEVRGGRARLARLMGEGEIWVARISVR